MVSSPTTVAREDMLNKEPLVFSTATNKGSHSDVVSRLLVLTSQGRSATGRNEGTPLIVIAQRSFNRCRTR